MNRVYLHSGQNEKSLVKVILGLLLPFMLYGFYKNGIHLYRKDLVSMVMMFKPLYLVLISIIISIIFSLIKKKGFFSYILLINILISLVVMPNINLLVYVTSLIILNIIFCFLKINIVPVFMIIVFVYELITKHYTFLNTLELSVEHKYSILDYLIGQGPGGISNTLWLFSLLSLVVLCFKYSYKKHIPISGIITFYILLIIYSIITRHVNLDLYMNNNFLFASVFIAPLLMFSPYTKGGCYLYGIILGILSFICIFLDLNIGIYFVIFILSLLHKLFDKIFIITRK